MLFLRSALFGVVFYAIFAGMMILGLPCLAMPARVRMQVVRLWARASLAALHLICGIRVEFRGLQHRPTGASILAVKHQSFLETIALICALGDFSYILKKELIAIPFFGWYLRRTGQIALDREKRASALPRLQQAVREKLEAGRQIIIFPEGTRRAVGLPPAYKPGVSALCARSGVACTPVALNTGLFWPRHTFKRRPGTVVIEFLPPIEPGLGKRAFMCALQNAIEPATDALVAEALAEEPGLDASLASPGRSSILARRPQPEAPST